MFESLLQYRYPKEFRIEIPAWPAKLLENTETITNLLQPRRGNGNEFFPILKEVCNGLWRIRGRLEKLDVPPKEIRGAKRFLESTWDSLTQSGVEIHNHTGETITGGEALRIISFEHSDQVTCDQVIETVKPTIYYKDKMIQMGEVIVGQPISAPLHNASEIKNRNGNPVSWKTSIQTRESL